MIKVYRENGAIGALLDEYENALNALKQVIQSLSHDQLIEIVDHETEDESCRSIQTILTHVLRAGYNYVIAIRKYKGESLDYSRPDHLDSIADYILALHKMMDFNSKLFDDYPKLTLEEHDNQKKILVSWGQSYDVEQLFEHAIVHILRHRRQIERFILKMKE